MIIRQASTATLARRALALTARRAPNAQYRKITAVHAFRVQYRSLNTSTTKDDEYLERYKRKLEEKAKKEGVKSVEELKHKLKDDIDQKKAEFNQVDPMRLLDPESNAQSQKDAAKIKSAEERKVASKADSSSSPLNDIKSLDKFIDVEKLSQHKDAKDIEMIWKARFVGKDDSVCGALTDLTYSIIYRNARMFPTFVLPLPHQDQGVELHYVQWSFAGPNTLHCMITSLAEYKLHQEYAKPHTTLIFHSDLMVDRGIVLMNGTVEADSAVTRDDGILLTLNLQRFYSAKDGAKFALVKDFNEGSANFSVDQLIDEAQKL